MNLMPAFRRAPLALGLLLGIVVPAAANNPAPIAAATAAAVGNAPGIDLGSEEGKAIAARLKLLMDRAGHLTETFNRLSNQAYEGRSSAVTELAAAVRQIEREVLSDGPLMAAINRMQGRLSGLLAVLEANKGRMTPADYDSIRLKWLEQIERSRKAAEQITALGKQIAGHQDVFEQNATALHFRSLQEQTDTALTALETFINELTQTIRDLQGLMAPVTPSS